MKRLLTLLLFYFANATNCLSQCTDQCAGLGTIQSGMCQFNIPNFVNTKIFVYNHNLYYTSSTVNQLGCPTGSTWDGANCYIKSIPQWMHTYKINDNTIYFNSVCGQSGKKFRVFIDAYKLTKKYEGTMNRADIAAACTRVRTNSCTDNVSYLYVNQEAKIRKKDLNSWVNYGYELTNANTYLEPDQLLTMMIYEKDNGQQGIENINYHCDLKWNIFTKNPYYGIFDVKYIDVNSQIANSTKVYDLDGVSVRIRFQPVN